MYSIVKCTSYSFCTPNEGTQLLLSLLPKLTLLLSPDFATDFNTV